MIIRNINGNLIKINRYDYPNDMIYFQKIMNVKKEFTKEARQCRKKNVSCEKRNNDFMNKILLLGK
jgi:hypothetical protein